MSTPINILTPIELSSMTDAQIAEYASNLYQAGALSTAAWAVIQRLMSNGGQQATPPPAPNTGPVNPKLSPSGIIKPNIRSRKKGGGSGRIR